ncbi:MAG: hypothetical protein L6V93_10155 [Clostridiales bacterium]|nr:MAG: hypothetical protein L6V93_10155 [Clostridiales bacterium]
MADFNVIRLKRGYFRWRKICSFCKREVTNGVCCDYCGTPLIFRKMTARRKIKLKTKRSRKAKLYIKIRAIM